MNIKLTIDAAEADFILAGAEERLRDLSPILAAIAGEVQDRIDSAFELERDPVTLTSWPPLKPATVKRRQKSGHDGPMLQMTRALLRTTQVTPEARLIEVTTGVEYGLTHQFGDESRGIPARRYAGVSPEDLGQFEDMLRQYVIGR